MSIVGSLIIPLLELIYVSSDKLHNVFGIIIDFWFYFLYIIKYLYYLESTAIFVGYASAYILGKSTKLKSK